MTPRLSAGVVIVLERPFADEGLANEVALAETPKSQLHKGLFRPKMTKFPTKGFVL